VEPPALPARGDAALASREMPTVRPPPGAPPGATAAPSDEPDSERSRPTADLGIVSSAAPSRGPSQAMLPPPPAPPDDDAALRAAGLHKRSGVAESKRPPPHPPPVPMRKQASAPAPPRAPTLPASAAPARAPRTATLVSAQAVRERADDAPAVDVATQERPSDDELTKMTDRGMDLRVQEALSGPLVEMWSEAAPGSGAKRLRLARQEDGEGGTMKSLAHAVVDGAHIYVIGPGAPTDEEWGEYLALVERHGVKRTMQFAWTDGGVPTPAQLARLKALVDGRLVPTAVVSSSARVRSTVTALAWLGAPAKAFRPEGLRDAFDFLGMSAPRREAVERTLAVLRDELVSSDERRPAQ
jgi:hypothetical protein